MSRPPVRRSLLVISSTAFALASYLAVTNLPPNLGPLRWGSLALAGILVLPTALLLGLEFREIAAVAGHRVGVLESFRVAMLASSSNLLPIPGAMAVKTGTLMAAGRSTRSSIGSNLLVAILWVGTALIIGAPFALPESPLVGWGSLAVGGGFLLAGAAGVRRSRQAMAGSRVLRVVLVEVGLTVTAAARIWFVIVGVGVTPTISAAVWLVVVSVLATVVGIFPAGLGLREGLSAAVGPLIGLDPAVAVLISAVDRVVRMTVLAVLAGAVAFWSSRASR